MSIQNFLKKRVNNPNSTTIFLSIIIIALASLVPIFLTYGRLNIGGDIIIPLNPQFSFKNSFEWLHYTNGVYASNDNFQWITLFFLPTILGLNIYQSAFVIQFLIFFFSGLGIYAIFHLWYKKNYLLGTIPAIAFIYSPHRYDHMIYFYGTATIIWLLFFLFKFLKNKQFTLVDSIIISILIGFIGNLPNPKYHFFVFFTYVIGILIGLLSRIISWKDLIKNLPYIGVLVLTTAYLWLPFIYFGYSFSNDQSIYVPITHGEGNKIQTVDYGLAPLYKMITLWHSPNLNKDDAAVLNSGVHLFFQYIIPAFVLGLLPILILYFDKTKRRIYFIYYFFALLFVFLAKSSNAPFGDLYLWVLQSHKVFAFLRTGAGIVIFAAIFYALNIGILLEFLLERVQNWRRYVIGGFIVITILISGFHIWSGRYFRSFSPVNKEIDNTTHGLSVPADYFKAAAFIAQKELYSKVEIFPGSLGYQNNTWGYFGPIIYPWFIDKPTVTVNKVHLGEFDPSPFTNTRYAFDDKSLHTDRGDKKTEQLRQLYFAKTHKKVFSSQVVDVYQRLDDYFTPLFYTAGESEPFIEYRAITPTLYKLIIHNATGPFKLVFTDNFHDQWKLYKGDSAQKVLSSRWKDKYAVSTINSEDQARTAQIEQLIQTNNISYINDNPGFISKVFKNTYENKNIPATTSLQSLIHLPLQEGATHIKEQAFNAWEIDPQILCSRNNAYCSTQKDGTYTFETLVQFEPQRVVMIGYLISIFSVLLTCIAVKFKKLRL